ncbi:MAG: hypothetical protein K5695_12950 [Oscillospiraceae bacterium]|nr:hypothetical protein [Oscillospiraceae bacterium]
MSQSPQFVVKQMDYTTVCTLPTPAENGVSITPERIWSQNAGRSSSTGLFVGDVIARKYTVSITYDQLDEDEVQPLIALTDTTVPFWRLDFPFGGNQKSMVCYIPPPTYQVKRWDKERQKYVFEGVKLEFIQQ